MWIEENVAIVLAVCGLATMTMAFQAVAPMRALRHSYRATVDDGLTLGLASQNGVLIAALGALLLCAAFEPALRVPVILAAGATKALFAARVLARHRDKPVVLAAAADVAMLGLFGWYLATAI
jgi:hypothetical protein